jgi:hypothetical protein
MEFGRDEDEDVKSKSLETLLLEKNRALQSENTTVKVSNSEMSGKMDCQNQFIDNKYLMKEMETSEYQL